FDSGGLTAKDQVMVTVEEESTTAGLIVPKFFSPNDDGINDYWEWQHTGEFPEASVSIFNRFGQTVYENASYQNNWDGKLNGKPLEDDAYYYIIDSGAGLIKGAVRIIK
ncbi:MAG TPA: gliding motility-associated C-terminal domain-containing protein, partial [Chryseosolibacter sp.]|nr:gliding motility-associated C-terminal domain-containing protein [Chryseosolibacter sp.]